MLCNTVTWWLCKYQDVTCRFIFIAETAVHCSNTVTPAIAFNTKFYSFQVLLNLTYITICTPLDSWPTNSEESVNISKTNNARNHQRQCLHKATCHILPQYLLAWELLKFTPSPVGYSRLPREIPWHSNTACRQALSKPEEKNDSPWLTCKAWA